MALDDKLPSIDKLNDSNWPIWKLQMTAYLQAKELWGLVDGSVVRPERFFCISRRFLRFFAFHKDF